MGALAPDLRCAIAHRGILGFRVRCRACHRAVLRADPLASPRNYLRQFAAKQYNRPSPPVLIRSFWLQPPSGPREGCDAFQDLTVETVAGPLISECPTMAAP